MPVNAQTLQPGWLEFDPDCMVTSVVKCIDATIENLEKLDIDASDIVAIGIASQRCTAIAWDKTTDRLIYPACIMAADIRTKPMIEQLTKVKALFHFLQISSLEAAEFPVYLTHMLFSRHVN